MLPEVQYLSSTDRYIKGNSIRLVRSNNMHGKEYKKLIKKKKEEEIPITTLSQKLQEKMRLK